MSDLPPNIDAILSSIRSRMNEEVASTQVAPPHVTAMDLTPRHDIAAIGAVAIGDPMTLEALIRSMLEPMLKQWLDGNMPEIVERMAQAEIKRLTGKD